MTRLHVCFLVMPLEEAHGDTDAEFFVLKKNLLVTELEIHTFLGGKKFHTVNLLPTPTPWGGGGGKKL